MNISVQDASELSAIRNILLDKLSVVPVSIDELVDQCGTSPSIILTLLLELELAGNLRRSVGGKVALISAFGETV